MGCTQSAPSNGELSNLQPLEKSQDNNRKTNKTTTNSEDDSVDQFTHRKPDITPTVSDSSDQPIFKENEIRAGNPQKSALVNSTTIYKGAQKDMKVLCLDKFKSRYTGETMYKWRKTIVVDVLNPDDDRNMIRIHYDGWSDGYDETLDLNKDMVRLCPIGFLTKEEIDKGKTLDENLSEITRQYFLTGYLPDPPYPVLSSPKSSQQSSNSSPNQRDSNERTAMNKSSSFNDNKPVDQPENINSNASRLRVNTGSSGGGGSDATNSNRVKTVDRVDSGGSLKSTDTIQSYSPGNMLDVLDVYFKTNSKEPSYKWRKAKILSYDNTLNKIRITYLGWDSKYDETLDLVKDKHRISPFGTKSNEQTSQSVVLTVQTSPRKKPQRTFIGKILNYMGTTDDTAEGNERQAEVHHDGEEYPSPTETHQSNGSNQSFMKSISKFISGGKKTNTTTGQQSPTSHENSKLKQQQQQKQQEEQERQNINHAIHKSTEEMEEEIRKEKAFLSALGKQKLHVFEIEGDGNCLFRAISHQLYLNEEHHELLRSKCVEHLKNHQQRFRAFCPEDFESYIQEMSQPGTWGDDLEIRALEEIIDRHILIYSSEASQLDAPINFNKDEAALLNQTTPLKLSYHGQNHYNSIYDEAHPPPVPPRNTSILLQARIAQYEGQEIPQHLYALNNQINSQMNATSNNNNLSSNSSVTGFQSPAAQYSSNSSVISTTTPVNTTTNNNNSGKMMATNAVTIAPFSNVSSPPQMTSAKRSNSSNSIMRMNSNNSINNSNSSYRMPTTNNNSNSSNNNMNNTRSTTPSSRPPPPVSSNSIHTTPMRTMTPNRIRSSNNIQSNEYSLGQSNPSQTNIFYSPTGTIGTTNTGIASNTSSSSTMNHRAAQVITAQPYYPGVPTTTSSNPTLTHQRSAGHLTGYQQQYPAHYVSTPSNPPAASTYYPAQSPQQTQVYLQYPSNNLPQQQQQQQQQAPTAVYNNYSHNTSNNSMNTVSNHNSNNHSHNQLPPRRTPSGNSFQQSTSNSNIQTTNSNTSNSSNQPRGITTTRSNSSMDYSEKRTNSSNSMESNNYPTPAPPTATLHHTHSTTAYPTHHHHHQHPHQHQHQHHYPQNHHHHPVVSNSYPPQPTLVVPATGYYPPSTPQYLHPQHLPMAAVHGQHHPVHTTGHPPYPNPATPGAAVVYPQYQVRNPYVR